MKEYLRVTLLILAILGAYVFGTTVPDVEAQAGRGKSRAFAAQNATGQTTGFLLNEIVVAHTAELIVTGSPTACTYRLQGSRDGSTWFNISAADITCTSTTIAFVTAAPTQYIRGNLLTLSGGTSPTVTLKYIGR